MANDYSMGDLLDFLSHAGDRGLMPAATAQALAVAVRNVFSVLGDDEQEDLRTLDLDATIRRFNNKRARDFNPASLTEYGRRVRRAVDLYNQWKENPADFSVRTRAAPATAKKDRAQQAEAPTSSSYVSPDVPAAPTRSGGYQSSFPVRPGRVVTLSNIPEDLTAAEAEKLAQFVRMLAVH
ncbi:MAG: hypothetical protein ACT4O1_07870 [Gemmatimonadota bacterium]